MTDPGFVDLTFPLAGQDVMAQVGGQPPNTTPLGRNVRALDPRTRRLRGGSRSGLTRYIDATPGGLTDVIQHLAVVTTHGTGALLVNDPVNPVLYPPGVFPPGGERPPTVWEPPPPGVPPPPGAPEEPTEYPEDWVEWPDPDDERFPLGPPEVPPGGGGTQPNPNVPPLGGGGSSGWVWLKGTSGATLSPHADSRTDGLTLSDVQDNQLLVLAVFVDCVSTAYSFEDPPTPSSGFACVVSDSSGNAWTQARAEFCPEDSLGGSLPNGGLQAFLFWCRCEGAASLTVSAQVTADLAPRNKVREVVMALGHYGGLENSSPGEGGGGAQALAPVGASAQSLGSNVVSGSTRLAVGVFGFNGGGAAAAAEGFTKRMEGFGGSSVFQTVVWVDDLSTGASADPGVGWVNDVVTVPLVGVGAGFRFGV